MSRSLALGLVLGVVALASANVYYDTQGFSSYTYGPLNGQGVTPNVPLGWHDLSVPPDNMAVIADSPAAGGKTMRLQVPNIQGNTSAAEVVFAQNLVPLAAQITVEFAVYRETDAWSSNLWFFPNGNNPAYGLQWDGGNGVSQTLPLGFAGAGVPTVMDAFATVQLVFDFTGAHPTATGYYNNHLVTTVEYNDPNSPFTEFTGWTFSLQHDENTTNSDTETLWIDDFAVSYTPIPEPAGLLLLIGGALLRRRG